MGAGAGGWVREVASPVGVGSWSGAWGAVRRVRLGVRVRHAWGRGGAEPCSSEDGTPAWASRAGTGAGFAAELTGLELAVAPEGPEGLASALGRVQRGKLDQVLRKSQ